MSRELNVTFEGAGAALYAILRRTADDFVWRTTTSAFEAWDDANVATYAITLTDRGGDEYSADIPAAVSTGMYRARYYQQLAGSPATTDDILRTGAAFVWPGGAVGVPIPSGAWRYSDRAHVLALVGDANAAVIWSLDGDDIEDAGLMEQDGSQADTYIDRALLLEGLTVPIDTGTAAAVVVQSLADIGAHLTVWWGFHHRGLEELANRGVASSSDIAGLMKGYKDYADEELKKLVMILQNLNPDDDSVAVGTFESVPVVDSSEYCACDENGRICW